MLPYLRRFLDYLFVTKLLQRTALIQFCDTSHWRSAVGLTLNLKQSVVTPSGGFVRLDELTAKKAFCHYMKLLNRRIYGAAFRHHDKRLRVIPIVEKSADGRWHCHAAIEPPRFMDANSFGDIARDVRLQTPLGYGHGEFSIDADGGWVAYMAKLRGKSCLEDYLTA
jgi:hypothetical protein